LTVYFDGDMHFIDYSNPKESARLLLVMIHKRGKQVH